MQRLFWPVSNLDQLTTDGSLSQRLSLWAEDWLPRHGGVDHDIVRELSCSPDDDVLLFSRDGNFWAAVCFCSTFRNELLSALPSAWHRAGDDERQLLQRLAQDMLADLRSQVFGLVSAPDVVASGSEVPLPEQLASLAFETAPGETFRAWCSAEFMLPLPSVPVAASGRELRASCLAAESAELTASIDVPTSMDALLNLTAGDVLPLAPLDNSPLTLRVAGHALCSAYLGKSGEHKALLLVEQSGH